MDSDEKWPPWDESRTTSETVGKVNVYACPEGHRTVTVCLDTGTTPFMTGCRHLCCDKIAQSCFYRCDQNQMPQYGWRHPTREEYEKADESMKEYYTDGGLKLVRVWPHEIEWLGFHTRIG